MPYVVPYVGPRLATVRKSSLYLTDRLKAGLAGRAAQTGRSEADLIRAALEAALAEPVPVAAGSGPRSTHRCPAGWSGVGIGPGEADLLTVRAVAALRRADRVVAPTTAVDAIGRAEAVVRQALPGLAIERIPFAMTPTGPGGSDRWAGPRGRSFVIWPRAKRWRGSPSATRSPTPPSPPWPTGCASAGRRPS